MIMAELLDQDDAIEELDILFDIQGRARIQRPLRDKMNPLTGYDDNDFFSRYRMGKTTFTEILARVEPHLQTYHKNTNSPLKPIHLLALAVRCFATGDFQQSTGDLIKVSQSTISKQLPKVTSAICMLAPDIISFPTDATTTHRFFLDYCGLPSITGVIDGTYISIQSPGGPNAELFRCRKGFFSYNVQVICDEKLKILDIVTGWPGSTHDSRIWNNSNICSSFERGEKEGLLLGDSGYPISPYLMIPYPHPPNSRSKGRFNRALCKGRCTIERCIGVWKRRWPCLSKKLRCKYDRVPNIIVACATLHNLCILYGQTHVFEDNSDSDNYDEPASDTDEEAVEVDYRPGVDYIFRGEEIRDMLAERVDT